RGFGAVRSLLQARSALSATRTHGPRRDESGGYRRFMFVGTDYVLPRTAFMLMAEYERQQGLSLAETNAVYTPFGHVDYAHVVAEIAHLERGGKTAVIASLWGESSAAFHEELARRKLRTKVLHLSLEQFQ